MLLKYCYLSTAFYSFQHVHQLIRWMRTLMIRYLQLVCKRVKPNQPKILFDWAASITDNNLSNSAFFETLFVLLCLLWFLFPVVLIKSASLMSFCGAGLIYLYLTLTLAWRRGASSCQCILSSVFESNSWCTPESVGDALSSLGTGYDPWWGASVMIMCVWKLME